MKNTLTLLAALLLAPLTGLVSAQTKAPAKPNRNFLHAPSVNSDGTAASAGSQQAAFGVESIKLGGVMGHRIDTMIKGNLLKIDVEEEFLSYSRTKKLKVGFRATGLMLDAAVHLAAYSQQEELIRWKDHWIDELISTQDPDGYIGIILPGSSRGAVNFDLSEKGCILLALVNDYRIFGRTKSIEPVARTPSTGERDCDHYLENR